MKYLVNRETKEHRIATEYDLDQWDKGVYSVDIYLVEADPEGWIKHYGGECPLPDGVMCQWLSGDHGPYEPHIAGMITWGGGNRVITHYRPILDDKPDADEAMLSQRTEESLKRLREQEAEAEAKTTEYEKQRRLDLIDRLRASHKAASELPDIIAELREVLGPDLMKMLCTELNSKDITEPYMTDWRNWKKGDLIIRESPCHTVCFNQGDLYPVQKIIDGGIVVIDAEGIPHELSSFSIQGHFRFHSRPTKDQDK